MTQAAQIVDALGGTSAVAAALELTPSTVSSWKTSGRIPRWWKKGIDEIATEKGIDLDALPETPADAEAA